MPKRLSPTACYAILAVVLLVGLAVRLQYLLMAIRTPGFTWSDPDGYLEHALMLAGPHGWHWTFDVARYPINGQIHALPPLYSIFLSFIALWPGLPLSALIVQLVLAVAAIALVFALGRMVHSPAAGLLAASAYALSVSSIFNVWSTSQEALYLPLVLLAFLVLGRAVTKGAGSGAFAVAGALFGLAALTRSMPLFFVVPAAGAHVAMAPDRRAAARQAATFLCGFALLTVPYSIGLSRSLGQLTVIDSHGSIHLQGTGVRAPGVRETVAGLWQAVAAAPGEFFSGVASRARSLLHVNGGRQLQIYVVAANRTEAALWKAIVHLGTDGLLIAAVVLAPLGAVVCRNTRVAGLLILWAVMNVAIASLGGFGGARLRTPFEALLMLIGAAALVGGWRPRPSWTLALGAAGGILMAFVVLPQLPRSLEARPDYGVVWDSVLGRTVGRARGAGGFNVPAYSGAGEFAIHAESGEVPIRLKVRVAGSPDTTIPLGPDEERIPILWPAGGFAFVEFEATDVMTRAPAAVQIRAVGR
jgi:hypothetical protein